MNKNEKKLEEDTDYTDEQGGGEGPLTEQEFFETLDKVVKADPKKKRKSPDGEKTKTSE